MSSSSDRPAETSDPRPGSTAGGNMRLWGGRFALGPAAIMERINVSVDFDRKLALEDIEGSLAHLAMLAARSIVSGDDAARIRDGLTLIRTEILEDRFAWQRTHEDVHMNIEARLTELIGPAAGRLHTARSRNDQVATDTRLWLRGKLDALDHAARDLQAALIDQAERHAATIMPGTTHLQPAQPVTFGHHMLAYVEMLGRDRGRLADARKRLNESPLGAAALAGSPYPIDRAMTARALEFDRPMANSLDAVSDRDFAIEAMAALALLMTHLSRLGEEIVLWVSDRYRFIALSDQFTTGSSIMPQKRNPDAAELIRAKTGRVIGDLVALLVVMKGLPLAYSKDMQEDKEPLFDAVDTAALALAAMAEMIADMRVDATRMRAAAESGFVTATDLADYLVLRLGLPFREAHHATGRIVRLAESRGVGLDRLTLEELRGIEPRIEADVVEWIGVEASVARRSSFGGTAPERVAAAVRDARARFL